MTDYIDIYCERLGPEFWAEPLNAITNLSFFIAAFFAFKLARSKNVLDWRSGFLILMIAVIGTGSFLFHTLATFWAMMSDSLPILFYQIGFLILFSRYVMHMRWLGVIALFAAFTASMVFFYRLPDEWLNGSLGYAPALLFILGLGAWQVWAAKTRDISEKFGLLVTSAVFTISLTLRSLDMELCAAVPFGTHLFWHIFNGIVLYLTTRSYILNSHQK